MSSAAHVARTFRTRQIILRVGAFSKRRSFPQFHPSRCSVQQRTFVASSSSRKSDAESRQPGGPSRGEGTEDGQSSSQGKERKEKSAHALFYTQTLPAMAPVALLGSAVYLGLKLLQQQLETEKALDEANAKISALEVRVEELIRSRDERRNTVEIKLPPVIDEQKSSRWWFAQA